MKDLKKIAFKILDKKANNDIYWLACFKEIAFWGCSGCGNSKQEALESLENVYQEVIEIFPKIKEESIVYNTKEYLESILEIEILSFYEIEKC